MPKLQSLITKPVRQKLGRIIEFGARKADPEAVALTRSILVLFNPALPPQDRQEVCAHCGAIIPRRHTYWTREGDRCVAHCDKCADLAA
jgi:hypothetical protein